MTLRIYDLAEPDLRRLCSSQGVTVSALVEALLSAATDAVLAGEVMQEVAWRDIFEAAGRLSWERRSRRAKQS